MDDEIRNANMRNHSATHLMHKALRDVLGEHVEQKGSLVTAESTRFDISHPQAVTAEEIAEVERRVNEAILANVAVNAAIMSMEDAQKTGAMMLFGEKYGDEVRVLQMGGFSTELCGGTHVSRTGDIGLFKIISEGGIAAGVRRIEAITGLNALKWAQEQERLVKDIIAETKAQTEKDVLAKIQAGAAHAKALEKELARAKAELAVHAGAKLLEQRQRLGRGQTRCRPNRSRCRSPARNRYRFNRQIRQRRNSFGSSERRQSFPVRRRIQTVDCQSQSRRSG